MRMICALLWTLMLTIAAAAQSPSTRQADELGVKSLVARYNAARDN